MSKQQDALRFVEELIEAVSQDVEEKIESMEPEECMQFTREFLEKMAEWQPEAVEGGDGVTAAAAAMFLSMMFVPAFSKAYEFTNNFLTAREALYKAMEENGNL